MGQGNKIPPPGDNLGNDEADDKTRQSDVFTEGKAHRQVVHCRFGEWFRYGTDDKIHAGALILSFTLLILIGFLSLLGLFPCLKPDVDVLKMLGNALLLTIGAAIGRSTNG